MEYSGHEYEHRNHVNRFYNSFAPVCVLQTGAFCRFLRFCVGNQSPHASIPLATQRWNRRCSAWIRPKEFFPKFFCAFAKTHGADRSSGERGRKPYHPPLRTRREVNTWSLIRTKNISSTPVMLSAKRYCGTKRGTIKTRWHGKETERSIFLSCPSKCWNSSLSVTPRCV